MNILTSSTSTSRLFEEFSIPDPWNWSRSDCEAENISHDTNNWKIWNPWSWIKLIQNGNHCETAKNFGKLTAFFLYSNNRQIRAINLFEKPTNSEHRYKKSINSENRLTRKSWFHIHKALIFFVRVFPLMTLIQQSLQHFRLQSQQRFSTCQSFQNDPDRKNILVTRKLVTELTDEK